jgi:hypothetical protein
METAIDSVSTEVGSATSTDVTAAFSSREHRDLWGSSDGQVTDGKQSERGAGRPRDPDALAIGKDLA